MVVLMAPAWLLACLPAGLCIALPWLLGASLGLTAWMPQRHDGLVALAFGMSLDRPEERTGSFAPSRNAGL